MKRSRLWWVVEDSLAKAFHLPMVVEAELDTPAIVLGVGAGVLLSGGVPVMWRLLAAEVVGVRALMMGMEAVVVALKAEMPHMVETRVVRKLQRAKGEVMKETSTRGSIPTILSQQVAEVGGMAAGHTRRMISLVVADLGTLVGSQGVALNREAMVQQIRVAVVQTVHRQELAVAAILAMLQKMVLSGLPCRPSALPSSTSSFSSPLLFLIPLLLLPSSSFSS